jgi:hypothetical protein
MSAILMTRAASDGSSKCCAASFQTSSGSRSCFTTCSECPLTRLAASPGALRWRPVSSRAVRGGSCAEARRQPAQISPVSGKSLKPSSRPCARATSRRLSPCSIGCRRPSRSFCSCARGPAGGPRRARTWGQGRNRVLARCTLRATSRRQRRSWTRRRATRAPPPSTALHDRRRQDCGSRCRCGSRPPPQARPGGPGRRQSLAGFLSRSSKPMPVAVIPPCPKRLSVAIRSI